MIAWFLEAGRVNVPEPPGPAVASALAWAARTASPYWLQQRVRAAVIAARKEQSRASGPGAARCKPGPEVSLDLAEVREALLAGGSNLATHLRVAELSVAEPGLETFAKSVR